MRDDGDPILKLKLGLLIGFVCQAIYLTYFLTSSITKIEEQLYSARESIKQHREEIRELQRQYYHNKGD